MLIAVLAVLVILSGCDKKPAEPGQPKDPDQGKVGPAKKDGDRPHSDKDKTPQPLGKADFSLAAVELAKECKTDEAAAGAKYKDKVIEVSGTVDNADRLPANTEGFVQLKSADGELVCTCKSRDRNIAGKLGPDQTVRLKGKFQSSIGLPNLADCEIVEKGPDTLILLTAEGLAKEYTADAMASEERLKRKKLLVTGEVSGVKEDDNKVKFIELKGDGKTVVEVRYLFGANWPPEWKVGAKVKMTADLETLGVAPGRCKISMQTPLDGE